MNEREERKWIEELAPLDSWNERIIMGVFAAFGLPKTYLDIGSGTGAMVNLARRLGVEAVGIDQLKRDRDYLLQMDLTRPIDLGKRFDLITSIEVAEHIPQSADGLFCDTIAAHAGGILVFSAAHPGQGGTDHLNCRPGPYWRTEFWNRGLRWNELMTFRLAHIWDLLRTPQYWLISNVQVFTA